VGDTLYGAPRELRLVATAKGKPGAPDAVLSLGRNFLHAASLEFTHPRTGKKIALERVLPVELDRLLRNLQDEGN
jgi:23S rRNA pseudouridine1911/1915/1917 synthase